MPEQLVVKVLIISACLINHEDEQAAGDAVTEAHKKYAIPGTGQTTTYSVDDRGKLVAEVLKDIGMERAANGVLNTERGA